MRILYQRLTKLALFLVLVLALPMLLLACGEEATPIPAATQKYLTALQGEGWKLQAQDLKVLGQAQNITFVQFHVGTRDVLRAFDTSFQPVSQADTVELGLRDLSYPANGSALKAEERDQLVTLTAEFQQLSDKISPLVKMDQLVSPLQKLAKLLPKIGIPLTKLSPVLRGVLGVSCSPIGGLVAISCIVGIVLVELVKVVGKRAENVQTQLVPTVAALADYLKISQSGPGSKIKEHTDSTNKNLTDLNDVFAKLDEEITPLAEIVDNFSGWLSEGEILQSLRQEAADVLDKIATPVIAYQKALDKREDKIKGTQKILSDTQQPLDNSVQNYLQMWAQKP